MKLREILTEEFGIDIGGAWIHNSGKVVDTEGNPHAMAIFLDPEFHGLTTKDLDQFCPNFSELRSKFELDDMDAYNQVQDCANANDGEWKPLYRFMYGRGWVRAFKTQDEASFTGNVVDFAKLFERGIIQRWIKGVDGSVHLSLSFNGEVRETTIGLARGAMGEFLRGVQTFI